MQKKTLVIIAVCIAAIVAAGCTTTSQILPQNVTASPSGAISVAIHPDITRYTVLMSSTVGIGLTPQINGTLPPDYMMYVWKTDYGHFVGWSAPDYTVSEQGNTVASGNDTKVYWTYIGENESGGRPPVHITLDIIDRATGTTLGHAEQVIGWDTKNDTAVIG
jgi:hypothetical protein